MKTYSKITNENKDIIYLLNIDGSVLRLTKPYNSISDTYGSLCLTVYDDAFYTLKCNMGILDLGSRQNIDAELKSIGYRCIPADNLQNLLYS